MPSRAIAIGGRIWLIGDTEVIVKVGSGGHLFVARQFDQYLYQEQAAAISDPKHG